MTNKIKTAWDDFYGYAAFIDFVRMCMSDDNLVRKFTADTGITIPRVSSKTLLDDPQYVTVMQPFVDYCESLFGKPE